MPGFNATLGLNTRAIVFAVQVVVSASLSLRQLSSWRRLTESRLDLESQEIHEPLGFVDFIMRNEQVAPGLGVNAGGVFRGVLTPACRRCGLRPYDWIVDIRT